MWTCLSSFNPVGDEQAMAEKRPEKEERVVSPSLIRPWTGEKFKYHPKFDLGIGTDWMGTADNIDVGIDDMTSLFDFSFEVDFLESIDKVRKIWDTKKAIVYAG